MLSAWVEVTKELIIEYTPHDINKVRDTEVGVHVHNTLGSQNFIAYSVHSSNTRPLGRNLIVLATLY